MNNALVGRPINEDAPAYAAYYFELTDCWDHLEVALIESTEKLFAFLRSIPVELDGYRYQPEKWSVKQVIIHMMETERIFQYRAFRLSRLDSTELAGFDEDAFVANSNWENRTLARVTDEFYAVRQSTIHLFSGMSDAMLNFRGHVNGTQITTRSLGWLIVGHAMHHKAFIKEKYLLLSDVQ